jgi:exosortase
VSITAHALETPWNIRGRIIWSWVFLLLILLLYAPVLKALWIQWWSDPDYSYAFLVPLFSGYVVWRERARWMTAEIRPNNFGLAVMLGAVALLLAGSLGAELFTSRVSLIVLLAGIILFLAGWKVLRAVSFPLGFLLLMIPIPAIIYNQITFPLQLLASRLGTVGLESIQVPVLREGNVLVLPHSSLEVVEACSGIRSLMSLISLAVAYLYLTEARLWVRYALVILMVPTTIVANAIRITGAGVLAYRFGPQAAEGVLHGFSDWIMFVIVLILMGGYHRIFRQIGKKTEEARHA